MVLNWRHRTQETWLRPSGCWPCEPANALYRHLRASALLRLGEDAAAAEAYGAVLEAHPDQALPWMSYGHALKTIGRQAEAVAAYRRAWRSTRAGRGLVEPGQPQDRGFDDADVAAMRRTLARADLRRRPAAAALRARQGARGRRPRRRGLRRLRPGQAPCSGRG
jgi:tetratricopeptide (TPR) repeat protein